MKKSHLLKGLRLLSGALIASAVVASAVLITAAQGQTPASTICGSQGGLPGPRELTLGNTSVTLPAGYTYVWSLIVSDPSGSNITVCIVELNAQVSINSATGQETGRIASSTQSAAAIDQLLRSVRVAREASPTSQPTASPNATSRPPSTQTATPSSTLQPPNTGDAGLR